MASADTFALSIRPATEGIAIAASTARIPMTTRSSIRVKPCLDLNMDFNLLKDLCSKKGVSGDESEIAQFIAEEMRSTFRKQAIDGFYENLDFYLSDYEATSLITVNDVTILDVNLNDGIWYNLSINLSQNGNLRI